MSQCDQFSLEDSRFNSKKVQMYIDDLKINDLGLNQSMNLCSHTEANKKLRNSY